MPREYPTLLDLVGSTPIVRLDRFGAEVAPALLDALGLTGEFWALGPT